MDPELLYDQRSKSVIRRKEEILKIKEAEAKKKAEAKYQKIE